MMNKFVKGCADCPLRVDIHDEPYWCDITNEHLSIPIVQLSKYNYDFQPDYKPESCPLLKETVIISL